MPTAAFLLAAGTVMTTGAYASEAGDFVVNWPLKALNAYKAPESHSSYIELESWNTGDMGHGSCVGVEGGGETCSVSNLEKDFDEAYCRSSCNGNSGKERLYNNNPFEGHYTGWAYWR